MCGLCGFAQSDAELLLSADLSQRDGGLIVKDRDQREQNDKKSEPRKTSAQQAWQERGVSRVIAEVWQNHFGAPGGSRNLRRS